MSSITKLNYLSDTKDLIKESLNQFNVGITDEDTFRSYVDKIKGIYNNWEKVTGENTELSLSPTRKGKMNMTLKGNTSQTSTSISGGDEYDSPSPDHAQPVHVVTGNNTINIGGTNYPVNLGSIELCKIGDYQDYLYKDNGNWYKYNAIDKTILTEASNNWYKSSITSDTYSVFQASGSSASKYPPKTLNIFCDKFIPKINVGSATIDGEGISTNSRSSAGDTSSKPIRIAILKSRLSEDTVNGFKEWLSTNNVTVYIQLNEATSTQITDTTLIEQLEAISNAMSANNTTSITQTNADLPFIISASALKKGGN